MENLDIKKTLTSLRNLCAKREYCVSDIMEKALKALDGSNYAASEVVAILVREGYLDNRRYAAAFARDKSVLSGWGRVKIGYALRQKGISREDAEYGISQIDQEKASAKLDNLIMNRIKYRKDEPDWRMKVINFALGRGYGYDEILDSLDRALANNES